MLTDIVSESYGETIFSYLGRDPSMPSVFPLLFLFLLLIRKEINHLDNWNRQTARQKTHILIIIRKVDGDLSWVLAVMK